MFLRVAVKNLNGNTGIYKQYNIVSSPIVISILSLGGKLKVSLHCIYNLRIKLSPIPICSYVKTGSI